MALRDDFLSWDQTLFRDMEVFDISYVPEQFNYREAQMQQMSFAIKPALRGGRIIPTVCRGLPGTGKTTSVHKLFEEITAATRKIIPVIVNCNIDNTEYAIFSRIYTKLTGLSQPPSGTALKALLDMIAKYIISNNIVPLVCLDDANYLVYAKELNNVLYPLMRFHEEYESVNFGVILILSDMAISLSDVLDIRVSSVFRYETVEFAPYKAREIAGILNARVTQGLYPKVMPAEIMDSVVDLTMNSGGDIRVGLDLIRRSALYAENDARKQVVAEDLEKAYSFARDTHLRSVIQTLDGPELSILKQIVQIADRKEITTSMVRDSFGEGKKAPRAAKFNESLEKLQALQLISLEYLNQGSGRKRLVRLKCEKSRLISLIESNGMTK